VNLELERSVSEDEAAHAGVERTAHSARDRTDEGRRRLETEREAQRRLLSKRIDDAVDRILADAEQNVAARRAHREDWLKEYVSRADTLLETGADTCVGIIRDRPRKKTF
jgi:DNA-binding SARP family transcriptional activator